MASINRILVTGGAGFLGSHLCERLVEMGHDVICIDNFFTSQKTNVAHLLGCGNFELLRHDVIQPLWLEVDEIYNLACPAAPGHYQYNPIKTMKTSVMGAINVLGMAKRCRAKVLQASTSEVYGDPEVHPQPETYRGAVNPIGPRACYDEGKRAAETLFMDYHRANSVNIRIVRIFNTYGPRMHPFDGRVVSNFIRQAISGDPITIFGSGNQTVHSVGSQRLPYETGLCARSIGFVLSSWKTFEHRRQTTDGSAATRVALPLPLPLPRCRL